MDYNAIIDLGTSYAPYVHMVAERNFSAGPLGYSTNITDPNSSYSLAYTNCHKWRTWFIAFFTLIVAIYLLWKSISKIMGRGSLQAGWEGVLLLGVVLVGGIALTDWAAEEFMPGCEPSTATLDFTLPQGGLTNV